MNWSSGRSRHCFVSIRTRPLLPFRRINSPRRLQRRQNRRPSLQFQLRQFRPITLPRPDPHRNPILSPIVQYPLRNGKAQLWPNIIDVLPILPSINPQLRLIVRYRAIHRGVAEVECQGDVVPGREIELE